MGLASFPVSLSLSSMSISMVSSNATISGSELSVVGFSGSYRSGGRIYSLVVSVRVSFHSLLLSLVSLSEESLSSWWKVLKVVDLCPEMMIV